MPPLSRSRDHRLSAWRSGPSAYELMTEVRRAEPSTSVVSGSMTHDTRTDESFECEVMAADALLGFHHPYAYASRRRTGHLLAA